MCVLSCDLFFFFKQKTAYEMRISDWSSDVCSSDLHIPGAVYSNYLRSGWRTEMDGVPAQLPRQETLEALIGELGIANDSHVVVVSAGTDALDISSAAPVYSPFEGPGHDRVRSEGRRIGKEGVRTWNTRWWPEH